MKRVYIVAVVRDDVPKSRWMLTSVEVGGELERYEERAVPKDRSLLAEYSFDAMKDALSDGVHGAWLVVKSFAKLAAWAVVSIVEAVRWLWRKGVGR